MDLDKEMNDELQDTVEEKKYYIYVKDGKAPWVRAKTCNSKVEAKKRLKVYREFARDVYRDHKIVIKYKLTTKLK